MSGSKPQKPEPGLVFEEQGSCLAALIKDDDDEEEAVDEVGDGYP